MNATSDKRTRADRLYEFWRQWRGVLTVLLLMAFFRSAVADWYLVPTGSMKPTIVEGDRVLVNKFAYGARIPFTMIPVARWDTPARGDIVVFRSPADGQRLIKRVVGVAGDIVWMEHNRLFVNGEAARYRDLPPLEDEADVKTATARKLFNEQLGTLRHPIAVTKGSETPWASFGPVRVPDGHIFVLGDNRDHSADSRFIGPIPLEALLGRAHTILLSLDHQHYFLPRAERFMRTLP